MTSAEQVYKHLADLYRVAFWLTGSQEASVTLAVDALDSLTDRFALLRVSIRVLLRKAIIEKALAAAVAEDEAAMGSGWAIPGQDHDEARLNDAVFHLGLLSRRILVLSVLEGYTIRETSRLLLCDVDTVNEMRWVALSDFANALNVHRNGTELHSNEAAPSLF